MSRIIVQIGGGLIRDVYKVGKGEPKEVVVVDLEPEQDEIDSDPTRATTYYPNTDEAKKMHKLSSRTMASANFPRTAM